MQRREFITLIAGVRRRHGLSPHARSSAVMPVVGFLHGAPPSYLAQVERSPGGTCTHGEKRHLVTAHTQS